MNCKGFEVYIRELYITRKSSVGGDLFNKALQLTNTLYYLPSNYRDFIICRNLLNDKIITKEELAYCITPYNRQLSQKIVAYTRKKNEPFYAYLQRLHITSDPMILFSYYLEYQNIELPLEEILMGGNHA